MKKFIFSSSALDPQAYREQLSDSTAGGYASFEGWVRNHNEGQAVTRLEYEAFEALANKEGERVVAEAIERFGVVKAACVHRVGSLAIGEMAVWVGVSSRHRAEAFAACRYIIDEVKHRVPIWKKEHYVSGDSGWVNCERCAELHEHAEHEHEKAGNGRQATGYSQNQRQPESEASHQNAGDSGNRASIEAELAPDYSRQIVLRDVGEAGQAKLGVARVLVIGAGGLGVPVLNYLAGAGVGAIGIAEDDTVDASNLHRQPLYSRSDVGKPKAELAALRLRELNPAIEVRTHERIVAANAAQMLSDYDLVIECSDNFTTKFLVNDAAVAAGKPAIFASIYQYEGQLQVYRPDDDSACLRCLWPQATRDGLVGNCAEAGVLGPVPGVLGSMQALEALKLLLGLPGQLRNEMLLIDLLTLEQRKLKTTHRADCRHDASRTLSSPPADLEISFGDLQPALAAGYEVIDIREPREVAELPMAGSSQHIPLGTLLADNAVLSPQGKYLLVCARGSRSRAAAEHLREHGFRHAYSLRGGLEAMR
ncbi:MAG TPA: ThiF family adenylyltransferase [Steroidobacteraceae bacterium]|jgi:adenylyltransferase/sulfurtransferase